MAIKVVSFAGNNGVGTISVPGVKAGDRVLSVLIVAGGTFGSEVAGAFIKFVLVDDELPQLNPGDMSPLTCTALLERSAVI